MSDEIIEKAKDRLEVLEKIEQFEKQGKFDIDPENDPPTIVLTPDKVDYLRVKFSSKIKRVIANHVGKKFLEDMIKQKKLIIKEVKGLENLENINSGAVITCNHFNPFDVFTVEKILRMSSIMNKRRLHKIIREGNYTNFPGMYGFLFRNCDTLPLSSNKRTMVNFMKAVDTVLNKKDLILIYPEQSLWWNYRKPRPLKKGAYRIAARNNVPVIPIFITMEDSDIIDDNGFPVQEYTINILKPIQPNSELGEKDGAEKMLNENYEMWKKVYEDFYGVKLEYITQKLKEY